MLSTIFLLAITAPAQAGAVTPVTGKTIMLDAGHGGFDPGAVNPNNGVAEKWINLAVVHRLKDMLEADGARVMWTRIDDSFVGLDQRAAIANAIRPDVFVSVHHNSTGNPVTNGTETYYTRSDSIGLADSLNTFLVADMQTANRGVHARSLAVTRMTTMPAVLTEGSFITSDAETNAFIKLDRVEQEAHGLQQGLLNYFAHR
ncbi:MAG: N-acetylmuramoyl-L-alanine amidase [Actinomycetota bacterium]|nr:N-acetylmuramoyl-L-alanine amidase [Actinomycetota bacterium]